MLHGYYVRRHPVVNHDVADADVCNILTADAVDDVWTALLSPHHGYMAIVTSCLNRQYRSCAPVPRARCDPARYSYLEYVHVVTVECVAKTGYQHSATVEESGCDFSAPPPRHRPKDAL